MAVRLSIAALACLCVFVSLSEGVSALSDVPMITTLGLQETLSDVEIQNIADQFDAQSSDGDSTGWRSFIKQEGEKAVKEDRSVRQEVSEEKLKRETAAYGHIRHTMRRELSLSERRYRNERRESSIFYARAFRTLIQTLGLTRRQTRYLQTLIKSNPNKETAAYRIRMILLDRLGSCAEEYTELSDITCGDNDLKYRRLDGSCNNLNNPQIGMAGQPFERFVPAEYEDDEGAPRITSFGRDLPNARDISLQLHTLSGNDDLHETISHFVMQWGQFMDHDLTLAPMTEADDGKPLLCCAEDNVDLAGLDRDERAAINEDDFFKRPFCSSIRIGVDDPTFSSRTCQPMVRSAPTPIFNSPDEFCGKTPREQFSVLTAFVDGSQVYGSSNDEARSLRDDNGNGATLKSQEVQFNDETGKQTLLPEREREECVLEEPDNCFVAGDERVNEHPALASMHTVLVREHNRIVGRMRELNERILTDEELYQQARRIVIAQIQAITYGEFLPILLDSSIRTEFNLNLDQEVGYDSETNPTLRNEFSTAAYRIGHTLVDSEFKRIAKNVGQFGTLLLSENYERSANIYKKSEGGPDSILRGLAVDPAQSFDEKATPALRDELFKNLDQSRFGLGMDLFALNNQRGRDHGIPSYINFLRLCGSTADIPTSFDDLPHHDATTKEALESLYGSVEDIDLFAGGISEKSSGSGKNGKGIAGPTFQCIIARQFQLLRKGDRFFFTSNVAGTDGFTSGQMDEIRDKASLSSLLCRNVDIHKIQKNAFLLSTSQGNNNDDDDSDDKKSDDGNSDDGNSDDGNNDDGNSDDGNSDDGNSDDGNSDDGNSDYGNSDDGNSDDGNSDDGNSDDGNSDNDDDTHDDDYDENELVDCEDIEKIDLSLFAAK